MSFPHSEQPTAPRNTGNAGDSLPLDIAQLIATRICHDLSGPVGAMAAGTELLDDREFLTETAALLSHSSSGAMARLRLLRAAFGIPGAANAPFDEMVRSYSEAAHGPDVALVFKGQDAQILADGMARQLALNVALFALDAIPGRGTLTFDLTDMSPSEPAQGGRIDVEITARHLALKPGMAAALEGHAESLTPRTVQAYWTYCLSTPTGGVEIWENQGMVRLSARLPWQAL